MAELAQAPLLPMTDDDNVWIAASDGDIPKVQAYIAADPVPQCA